MFLNITAHSLTPEQKEKALEYSNVLIDLKEEDPRLWERLSNCPPDVEILKELAKELLHYLEIKYSEAKEKLTLHFPIGSPAFMALFFLQYDKTNMRYRIVFSHSERKSMEELQANGSVIKKGIFQFVKFIEI
ncbi:MAG: hypothetical protein SFU98_02150 [Leptospiraceae bacterium]|nr:hypothetical protein [Leptospiraceae bacterium]